MDIVPIPTKSMVETEWRLRDIFLSISIIFLATFALFYLSDLLANRWPVNLINSVIGVISFGCGSSYLLIKYPLDLKKIFQKQYLKVLLIYGIIGGLLASSKNLFLFFSGKASVDYSHIISVENSSVILSIFLVSEIFLGPVVEELFWRGGCYRIISKKYSVVWGAVITSFFFSITHIPGTLQVMLESFLVGLIYVFLYEKTKVIGTSIVAHILYNAVYYSATYYQLI